jgi:hypothetical protein
VSDWYLPATRITQALRFPSLFSVFVRSNRLLAFAKPFQGVCGRPRGW